MTSPPTPPGYAGYRFPAAIISFAVWLYFRFPFSLRHVDEILAARGIVVSHETVRQWGLKFGQAFANQIRRRLPRASDKWHLDEVAVKIAGVEHWLWRAVNQDGFVLDVLVQRRRDKAAAARLLRKLLKEAFAAVLQAAHGLQASKVVFGKSSFAEADQTALIRRALHHTSMTNDSMPVEIVG